MDVRGLDLKPEENVVKARGELSVFVLYGAEDTEAPVQWLEYSLPFSGEVECPDCTEELIPLIEASVMHQSLEAKPDVDGEERILVSDVVLELDMKFFREEEYDLITECIHRSVNVFRKERMRYWNGFWYVIFPDAGSVTGSR